MPRYGASKTDIGVAAGNLGASLLGGFGRRQGQMDGYRQLVNMTQAEQNQLENDELRRVAALDPYQQTFNDMGLIGAEAENYKQAITTGVIPEGVDPEKLRQGLALFNVYQRGGKVSDVEKAIGDAYRNYIGRQVTPDNIANIGGMIGALDGKPMEGLQAQLTTGIARGEEQPNTMRALMASQGKGLYDNMPGGVFNIDTGEQNINDLGRSVINKNKAQAYQAETGATENLAQASKANTVTPSGINVPSVKPVYDSGSDEWVYPPSEEFPDGRRTVNQGRKNAVDTLEYTAKQFIGDEKTPGLADTTTTGGVLGLKGKVAKVIESQKGYEFDNAVRLLSNDLRTIYRIPGEGALSDKEQEQYNLQLPSVNYDPALNKKIVKDLVTKSRMRIQTLGSKPKENEQDLGFDAPSKDWEKVNDVPAEIKAIRDSGDVEGAKKLEDEYKRQQQSTPKQPEFSEEDLQFTAKKYGITVEQVKKRLGI